MKQESHARADVDPPSLRTQKAGSSAGHIHGEEQKPQGQRAGWQHPQTYSWETVLFHRASLDDKYSGCRRVFKFMTELPPKSYTMPALEASHR